MFPVMQLIEKLKMFVISKSDLLNPWGGEGTRFFLLSFWAVSVSIIGRKI